MTFSLPWTYWDLAWWGGYFQEIGCRSKGWVERVCRDPEVSPPKHSHKPNSKDCLSTATRVHWPNPIGLLGTDRGKTQTGWVLVCGQREGDQGWVFLDFFNTYTYFPSMQVETMTTNQINTLLGRTARLYKLNLYCSNACPCNHQKKRGKFSCDCHLDVFWCKGLTYNQNAAKGAWIRNKKYHPVEALSETCHLMGMKGCASLKQLPVWS